MYSPVPVPQAKPPPVAILEQRQIQDLTERFALLKESAAAREAKEAAASAAADARVASLLASDPEAADRLATAAPKVALTKMPPGWGPGGGPLRPPPRVPGPVATKAIQLTAFQNLCRQ